MTDKLNYDAFNYDVFTKVPKTASKILDVGCGTGEMGKVLKSRSTNIQVDGITYSASEQALAAQHLDKIWIADLNKAIPEINEKYDCILFSHILEHTCNPTGILKAFKTNLNADGVVIIALPNVLQFKQRFTFLLGNFRYADNGGLMDVTHFRFFDWQSAQEMISNSGLKITFRQAYGNFPFLILRRFMPAVCAFADRQFLKYYPGLFGFQFIFTAQPDISAL